MQRVLLVGGSGYFGRLLAVELLDGADEWELVLTGRDERKAREVWEELAEPERTRHRTLDLGDAVAVDEAVAGADLAVCAAGPFQHLPTTLLEACLEHGRPYVDLSDDRGFVARVLGLVQAMDPGAVTVPVATGFSAVPALSAVLVRAAGRFDELESIDVQIAPGNRNPRSRGTVVSLLESIGRPFQVPAGEAPDGRRPVTGWSERRAFEFPAPVGRRWGRLVDVPDHEHFPRLFGARRVEFRASSELALLNGAVDVCAALSRAGWVSDWARWQGPLSIGMGLFGKLGTTAGALGVEVAGMRGGRPRRARASIVADQGGERIPVLPAAVLVRRLLSGTALPAGIVPWDDWITPEELELECRRQCFRLIVEELP